MVDIVTPEKRSEMMAGIKGKNTNPEIKVRKALHKAGFRFRLHDKKLPGKPDLVLPKHNAVIFVNGCFWHAHDCHLFSQPSTRRDFWSSKFEHNRERDLLVSRSLQQEGWRILVIWECALKGKTRLCWDELIDCVTNWIIGDASEGLVEGKRQ